LSEPRVVSSLSDITTRAVSDGDDFAHDPLVPRGIACPRPEMWISRGEHDGSRWINSRPAFILPIRALGKLFHRLFPTR
jgi:hypothetical protein